jgi:hypothetical protein
MTESTTMTTASENIDLLPATKDIYEQIKTALSEANSVLNEAKTVLAAAKLSQATHDKQLKESCTSLEQVQAKTKIVVESIEANYAKSMEQIGLMASLHKEATESENELLVLANKAGETEVSITVYEKRLADLALQCSTQLTTITGLLPGATSAGLASAFGKRGELFRKPLLLWQCIFVVSVGCLIALAGISLSQFIISQLVLNYDEIFRLWLVRVPLVGALIWLAMHASHESALAKRLEEDYGYKAAIAASFEGFHREMAKYSATDVAGGPLAKLCEDTLGTIASPPGRIYDKHKLSDSPGTAAIEAAKALIK